MNQTARFLSTPEWEKYSAPGAFVPRRLREVAPDPRTPGEEGELGTVVQNFVRSRMPRERGSLTGWFAWLSIVVKSRDGLSWSAEATAERLERQFGQFTFLTLSAARLSLDSLPLIASLVGPRRFYRGVVRNQLSPRFPTFQPWVKPLLWAGAILVAILLKFLDVRLGDLFAQPSHQISRLLDIGFYCVVVTALGTASQWLTTYLATQSSRQAVRELRDHLETQAGQQPSGFPGLVDDLAAALLKGPFPRFLLIDDFEGLDLTTRCVLKRYLDHYAPATSGAEIWILFEGTSGDRLGDSLPERRDDPYFYPIRRFEQLPLSAEERMALASRLGHPERASYTTVGSLCGPDEDAKRLYLEILRSYQLANPPSQRPFSDLQLLYLLWLNFQCSSPALETSRIVSNFARKEGLRAELLATFLKGTDHRVPEFDGALLRLIPQLKSTPLITAEEKGATTLLTVHEEAGTAFDRGKGELELPAAGLGHLYWAIFWFDRLSSHPVEAFWVRKLASHLTSSDLGPVRERGLYERALVRELDALIYTLRWAVRTCIYGPLPGLVRRAVAQATAESVLVAEPQRRRLREACWEAYSLTGNEEALAGYLRLLAVDDRWADGRAPETAPPLLRLFIDSLPLEEEHRVALGQYLAAAANRVSEAPLLEFGTLRAAYLALTSAELLAAGGGAAFEASSQAAPDAVLETAAALNRRLGALKPAEVSAADLINLNLALSCLTLLLRRELQALSGPAQLRRLLAAPPPGLDTRSLRETLDSLPDDDAEPAMPVLTLLLGAAQTALRIGPQLRGELAATAGTDLVRTALARELEYLVLASLNLAAHDLPLAQREIPAGLREGMAEVARLAAGDLRIPELAQGDLDVLAGEKVRRLTDKLLEQAAFLWRRFELHDLALAAQVRRIDLLTAFALPPSTAWIGSAPLREALHEVQGRQDYTNLVGCLALARLLGHAADLRADYFLQGAAVALGGSFGPVVKQDFALGALILGHHLTTDLGPYLDYLVQRRGEDGLPLLRSQLANLADDALETMALRLVNAAAKTSQAGLAQPVHEIVQATAETRSEGTREAVQAILRFAQWERDPRAAEGPEPKAVLHEWTPLRRTWAYAAVLDRLIAHHAEASELHREALQVLWEFKAHAVTFNSYYTLALNLSERFHRAGRKLSLAELPTSYVRESAPRWEESSPAATNERAYRLLFHAGEGRSSEFSEKVGYWSLVKLQHDEAARLLPFLRQGRYFSIFLYYFELLASWGLTTDRQSQDLLQSLHLTPLERQQRIDQWIAAGRRVPPPFLEQGGGSRVASDFVLLGKYLFQSPFLENPSFDDDRKAFDAVALKAVTRLLDHSAKLVSLPPTILDLMHAYSRRFERYSTPAEVN